MAADEQYYCPIGMAIVTEAARAAGAASLPSPLDDAGDDVWLYWTLLTGQFEFGSTSAFQAQMYTHMLVDSKSMRKVDDGSAIVIVAHNAAFSSTNMKLVTALRFLFMLH